MELSDGRTDAMRSLRARAEAEIERIVSELEVATGLKVAQVEADTQNFTTCSIEIWFAEPEDEA
jgi:hypothetical protein